MFGYQASSGLSSTEQLYHSFTCINFLHLIQKKKKEKRNEITARIQACLQDLSNKKKELVSSQLKAHGWIFFRTTVKWSRVFKRSSRVAATSFFSWGERQTQESFQYPPLTTPLSPCWQFPQQIYMTQCSLTTHHSQPICCEHLANDPRLCNSE